MQTQAIAVFREKKGWVCSDVMAGKIVAVRAAIIKPA